MASRGERKQANSLLIAVGVIVLYAAVGSPAFGGLMITRNFVSEGNTIPGVGVTAGVAPGSAAGGGNLESIFNAAADLWEASINDNFTTTINFGWAPLSSSTAARTDNTNFDNLTSAIRFDNDSIGWFLDPTPTESSEWGSFNQQSADLGVGVVNTGRQRVSPSGDAVGRSDLFTAALHEIGHALGMSLDIGAFGTAVGSDGDIDIVSPLPFPGTEIPIGSGAHIALSGSLMQPTLTSGVRSFMSEADILGVAQASGFTNVNLDPLDGTSHIPEPSSMVLLLMGSIMMLSNRPFRAGKKK